VGLADVFRKGIAVADSITSGLQSPVVVRRLVGPGSDGPSYATAVQHQGVVDYDPALVRTKDGKEVAPMATVLFPRPVLVGPGDEVTLPDGRVGEVLRTPGVADPATGASYLKEIAVG
jgi:hypothetical protein